MTTKPNLGVIAGSGNLPTEIANIYTKNGGQCFIAALDAEVHFNMVDQFNCQHFQCGQVGSIIKFFKENDVEKVIMIGGIDRPEIKDIKVDFTGGLLLARIMKNRVLGDDNVLKIISEYIEEHGFEVISPLEISGLTDYENSIVEVNTPNAQDEKDIELGRKVLKTTGSLDIGQSVVISGGYVLGLEAAEGTDNLIRRCELLRKTKKGGVLVKMAKQAQDMRLDIPTIGPDTIFYLAKHGYNGVAIEREKVIIVDPLETKALAAKNKLFISLV